MLRTAVAVKNFHLLVTSDIIKAGYPTYQSYQDLFAHETGMSNKTIYVELARRVRRRGCLVLRDELDSERRMQSMISICDCLLHGLRE
jgi:hypothetical protein